MEAIRKPGGTRNWEGDLTASKRVHNLIESVLQYFITTHIYSRFLESSSLTVRIAGILRSSKAFSSPWTLESLHLSQQAVRRHPPSVQCPSNTETRFPQSCFSVSWLCLADPIGTKERRGNSKVMHQMTCTWEHGNLRRLKVYWKLVKTWYWLIAWIVKAKRSLLVNTTRPRAWDW